MWYWCIPSGVITVACLALPHYIHGVCNYVECKGHWHRRNWNADDRDYSLFLRDKRISGDNFKQHGIEKLDEPIDISGGIGWIESLIGQERIKLQTAPK